MSRKPLHQRIKEDGAGRTEALRVATLVLSHITIEELDSKSVSNPLLELLGVEQIESTIRFECDLEEIMPHLSGTSLAGHQSCLSAMLNQVITLLKSCGDDPTLFLASLIHAHAANDMAPSPSGVAIH